MLASLANIFRIPDLRKKVLFTLTVIALYQFGANVPVPFVNFSKIAQLEAASKSSGVLGFLNLFSGGALTRMAVFGLGIMPYITSSIIIQLLATVIPKLEQWRDQGAVGQKKLTQTTRYLTVALALMQSTGLVYLFHKGGGGLFGTSQQHRPDPELLDLAGRLHRADPDRRHRLRHVAGRAHHPAGHRPGHVDPDLRQRGGRDPLGLNTVLQEGGRVKFATILLVSLALLVLIVFVDQGQRRIPVTFAKRVVGRKMYGGSNTYIPLKVNQAGVIPIIFASSVLYIPVLLSNIIPSAAFRTWVNHNVTPTSVFYILTYFLFILLFTFFYVYVAFDPHQQADIIRKQGGYIPGIRPGQPTERYLAHILNRITWPGALFLGAVAVTPSLLMAAWNITSYPFYGTTLLIAVGVALETMKQIDSQLMMRNYEGFLK